MAMPYVRLSFASGCMMQVGEILERKGHQVFAVGPDWPVREAVAMIAARNIGTTLVTGSEGGLLGIISERDVIRALSEPGNSPLDDLQVSDLMTRSVITCTPETTISDALSLMALHRIRHLPVVRSERILGLISIRDVLEFRMEVVEQHSAALVLAEQEASRAREEAELSNRAKTEFLANISHELKTPLHAVIGFAEVLTKQANARPDSLEFAPYLHEIEHNGRHLLDIVDNLLDLSRIEIRALEPRDEPLSIAALVSTCVRTVSERAERSGVSVQVEVDAALPALMADKRMMKQMLLNLLVNAVKFTPEGGRVSILGTVDEDGGIGLSVTDTGIGIAREHLAKVVEPFYQVEASITRRYEGAGLGLALVNAMIQAHGGVLSLDGETDKGTAAMLRFPPARTVGSPQHGPEGQSQAA